MTASRRFQLIPHARLLWDCCVARNVAPTGCNRDLDQLRSFSSDDNKCFYSMSLLFFCVGLDSAFSGLFWVGFFLTSHLYAHFCVCIRAPPSPLPQGINSRSTERGGGAATDGSCVKQRAVDWQRRDTAARHRRLSQPGSCILQPSSPPRPPPALPPAESTWRSGH